MRVGGSAERIREPCKAWSKILRLFRNRRSSDRIQHECTGDRRSVYGNLEGLTLTACLCRKRLSVFLPFWNNRPAERYARGPLAPTRARRVDREPEPGTRDARESRERARPSDARVAPSAEGDGEREGARLCPAPAFRSDGASSRGVPYFKHVRARHARARRGAHLGRGGGLPQRGAPVGDRVGFGGERPTDRAACAAIYPRAILANFLFIVGPRPRPLSSRAPRPPTARPHDAIARPLTPRPVPSQPAERRRGCAMDARSPDRTRGSRGDCSRIAAQPRLGRQRARRTHATD